MRRRGERGRNIDEGDEQEFQVSGPAGIGLTAKGGNAFQTLMVLLMVITLTGVSIGCAFIWNHLKDSEEAWSSLVNINKSIDSSIRVNEKTLRWLGCILATDPERRSDEYRHPGSRCNREL